MLLDRVFAYWENLIIGKFNPSHVADQHAHIIKPKRKPRILNSRVNLIFKNSEGDFEGVANIKDYIYPIIKISQSTA